YLIDCGAPVDALMINRGKRFEDLKAVFLTHMHEDHAGCLTGVVKEFGHYHPTASCSIFFAEEAAIAPFLAWNTALHDTPDPKRVFFRASRPGVFYEDDNIRVTGIPTDHIHGFATFSYGFELLKEGKRILFTGDMRGDLADYPRPAVEEHWNCIVSEMTHYQMDAQLPTLSKFDTDFLIFNHKYGRNIEIYPEIQKKLPQKNVSVDDGDSFIL
ncbi:MAG: MBL fold metallo-hydrolase, partial [Clostridia bacterium]|nr:MBL fold metallo-hydrolase [Clostridia bacterium]